MQSQSSVSPSRRRTDVDEQAPQILAALSTGTYEQVAGQFQTSRGKVYSLAVAAGARKHEARILERQAERKRRRIEFFDAVINATAKADVLDFLDGMPTNSVAMHLSSPPYNVARPYGGSAGADAHEFSYYLGWQLQVLSELARTLQEGGVLFYQVGSTRAPGGGLYPLDILLFQHIQNLGLTFQSRVAWVIQHGLTPKQRLAERYETALVFTKGPVPRTFNPTPARTPQNNPGKRAFKGPNKGQLSGHPFGAFPTNVWPIPNAGHNAKGRMEGHPAQMPLALAAKAIALYSEPGDLICDVFMGSGTTAEAAIRAGRAFTGCDLFYNDVRQQRLAAVAPDLVSPLPGVTEASLAVWNAEARPRYLPAQAPCVAG